MSKIVTWFIDWLGNCVPARIKFGYIAALGGLTAQGILGFFESVKGSSDDESRIDSHFP